jgi:hypothetical protein
MFEFRLSRFSVGLVLFALILLILLFLSSVASVGGASGGAPARVPEPPPKKAEEPKGPHNPLNVKGQLQDNDPNDPARNQPCKTYKVKLKKGKTYAIDMSSADFDAYLRLENAKGDQIAEDDDSGVGDTGLDAQIVFTPDADDTFKIIATRFADGTGNFSLAVRELVYKTGKVRPLAKGMLSVQDKLTNGDAEDQVFPKKRYKVYSVKMVAGRTYTIDLVSDDFDAWLRLTDAYFKKLAEDDDSGGNLNSRIVFTPKADGVYHIFTTCLDGQLGDYTLSVREEK